MNGRFDNNRGSILMETVLVIPLYLVVLSGIFWVGDLALLRSKSTFFDRFAAWSSGNRFANASPSTIKSALRQNFLKALNVGDQKVENVSTAERPASVWSSLVEAGTTVSAEPPVWTRNWRRVGAAMMGKDVPDLQKASFRSREIKADFLHSTLMRAKDDYRDKVEPRDLGEKMEWLTRVYDSEWPKWTGEDTRTVSGASPCPNYDRFTMYENWSD